MSAHGQKTILIIEDDLGIQASLSMILESEGYEVKLATDGKDGLALIQREGLPQIIFLDMLMPVMNGWEFATQFRALYGRQVPIVVMTAASNAKKRAEEVGADGFVSKPFSLESLMSAIQQQLG